MKNKIIILFGGKSPEHDISIMSAANIFNAIDKEKYELALIYIRKNGDWRFVDDFADLDGDTIREVLIPIKKNTLIINDNGKLSDIHCDLVIPVLHGPNGEDGKIQGLLEIAGIPYLGCGVLGSAISMDKEMAKRLVKDAGIVSVDYICLRKGMEINYGGAKDKLGVDTFFVKPVNMGSSVGISKVKNDLEFEMAIKKAFEYDDKILIEKALIAREIEVSVYNKNGEICTSTAGEIRPKEFYSYEEKYLNDSAELLCPAPLEESQVQTVQKMAEKIFEILELRGLCRVDFFLDKESGEFIFNEVNTFPGFTNISMFPKLIVSSGISQMELMDILILEALRYSKV